MHQTQIAGLAIAPSHVLLSDTDIEMTTAGDHQERGGKHLLWDSPQILGGAQKSKNPLEQRVLHILEHYTIGGSDGI